MKRLKLCNALNPALILGLALLGSAAAQENDYVILKRPVRVSGPVVTRVDGMPLYLYGNLYVNALPPDYQPGNQIQIGNTNPRNKIKPKKPWEIQSNYFGIPSGLVDGGFTSRYSFTSPHAKYEQYWPVNLIDGDPDTFWIVRQEGPYERPAREKPIEIYVDLPQETLVKQVNMLTLSKGLPERSVEKRWGVIKERYWNPLPHQLEILVSRDGHHWDLVYKTENLPPAGLKQLLEFSFPPRPAKEIMLRGSHFGLMVNPEVSVMLQGVLYGYTWAFSELQVLDNQGANVALASRGTGISIDLGPPTSWDFDVVNDVALAGRYDLGVKWLRANYWGGNLLWNYVEQEKGKYNIDPVSDLAVSEAAKNGINVIMGMEYGNWLYGDSPRANLANHFDPIPYDSPPAPTTPEQITAYTRWVRFMVGHFKDRVRWWEIWNEPSTSRERYGFGPDQEGAAMYVRLIQAAASAIHEADPQAKIMISDAYWPWDTFKKNVFAKVVSLIDAVELPFRVYEASLDRSDYRNLPKTIRAYEAETRAMGFKGVFMSEENQWFAEPNPSQWFPGHLKPTYIGQAKNLARLMLQNCALDVVTFWQGGFQLEDGTLGPAYYVLRTLNTITDGAKPSEVEADFSSKAQIEHYGLGLPDGRLMVAVWLPGDAVDNHPGETTDVSLPGIQAKRVVGIDVLNGCEQDLKFESRGKNTVVPGAVVRDYPLVFEISR